MTVGSTVREAGFMAKCSGIENTADISVRILRVNVAQVIVSSGGYPESIGRELDYHLKIDGNRQKDDLGGLSPSGQDRIQSKRPLVYSEQRWVQSPDPHLK
jgi:hypothetical protein